MKLYSEVNTIDILKKKKSKKTGLKMAEEVYKILQGRLRLKQAKQVKLVS